MKEAVTKIAFSFYPEDLENLEKISKDTGMKKTEVMRQLLKKCASDEKERELITKQSFWDKVQRKKGLASYNVHSVNKQKKTPEPSLEPADSLINQKQDTTYITCFEGEEAKKFFEWCKSNNIEPSNDTEWEYTKKIIESLYQ